MSKSSTNADRCWASWAVVAIALTTPALAAAQNTALIDSASGVVEAERLGEQAFDEYSKKHYREAVALYEHAYAIAPSPDALYNIARVYDLGLRDRARAIAAYQRFLAEPGAPPDRVERAAARASELLRAERAERSRQGAASPSASEGAAASVGVRDVEPTSSLSALRVGALVVGGVGVASAAVGGAFGLSVLSNADTAKDSCDGNLCTTQRGVDAANTASNHATLATLGVSVGAALMATGAVLWIAGGDSSSEPEMAPEHRASARLRMTPIASASELGLALAGGW